RKRYKTEDEEKAKMAELSHEVDKGVYAPQSDLTVETACAEWLAGKRIRKTTHAAYTYALQPLRDRHGSLPRAEVDQEASRRPRGRPHRRNGGYRARRPRPRTVGSADREPHAAAHRIGLGLACRPGQVGAQRR